VSVKAKATLTMGLLAAVLLLLTSGKGCVVPVIAPAKATAATYVFEKDSTGIPGAVLSAINKLNRRGITATNHEVDTVDGSGEIPDQYKVPVAAAKVAGLPSLVVTAGEKVLRVVKDPKTEEAVLEAVP